MDIKQIQCFIEASSTGSFTAAAKHLYISVPGLVKTIEKLESELGVMLFVRMRSGVILTPAGQVLARYALRYIREHEMIVSNVRKAAAQRETRAEVGMTWGMLSYFPHNFLSRFVLSNPDASLFTHNYTLRELGDALREYHETIGLYFGKMDESDLEVLFHREATLQALMASNNPLCEQKELHLADLKGSKIVLVNSDPEVMDRLQGRLKSIGCLPQIMLDGAEWGQAVELITSAGYISFCLPPGSLNNVSLQTRSVVDLKLSVDFNMVVMRGVAMTDAERRFADYVVKLMNANHGAAAGSVPKRR